MPPPSDPPHGVQPGAQKRGRGRLIGRTKGGRLNSKLHAVTDALGRPIRMVLTGGQTSDYIGARNLVGDLPDADVLLADRGDDADWFRKALKDRGISPCIPTRKCRKAPSLRPEQYQCKDCQSQFAVTTRTPMHATNLDLRIWICAMSLALMSSKGISSVVIASLLGVNRKTAWMLGHRIREAMDDRNGELDAKEGVVEVDRGYVGGAPKSLKRACNPPGKACGRSMVFVAASRVGQVRATIVPDDKQATVPIVGQSAPM